MPPNTLGYMVIGYGVIGTIGLLYVLSLVLRWRSLRQEVKILESLEQEEETRSSD